VHYFLLKIIIDLKSVHFSNFTESKLWIVISYVSSYQPNILSLEKVIWLSREKMEILMTETPKTVNIDLSINSVAKQQS